MDEVCLFNGEVMEHENETLPLGADSNTPILKKMSNPKMFITLFGRNAAGQSVAVIINDWMFHFFVLLEKDQDPEDIILVLRKGLPRGTLIVCEKHYCAMGFVDASSDSDVPSREQRTFLKLCFTSTSRAYWVIICNNYVMIFEYFSNFNSFNFKTTKKT